MKSRDARPPKFPPIGSAIRRANGSAAVWAWAFNCSRIGTAILLLPLLLRSLSPAELGIHYVLINMLLLLPALDSSVSFNLVRFVGHAMSGSQKLRPQGLAPPPSKSSPNYGLLWKLLHASRMIYQGFAILVAAVLLIYGYNVLAIRIHELESPTFAWIALALTVLGAVCDIYWSYWGAFLKGMNHMLSAVRLQAVGYLFRLFLALLLLLTDHGLLSLPIASLVGSVIQRSLVRRHCLRLLAPHRPEALQERTQTILKALLPNSWRVGLQLISSMALINFLSFLCVREFGLATTATYGISLQVFMIAASLSAVWSSVKWPRVNQLRYENQLQSLRLLVRQCFRRQMLTYMVLALLALVFAPSAIGILGSNTQLLGTCLLLMFAVNQMLEMNFSFWTVLLTAENKIPSMWPAVGANVLCMALAYALITHDVLGVSTFVLVPLAVGLGFNYWFWMFHAMHSIQLPFRALLFAPRRGESNGIPIDREVGTRRD